MFKIILDVELIKTPLIVLACCASGRSDGSFWTNACQQPTSRDGLNALHLT